MVDLSLHGAKSGHFDRLKRDDGHGKLLASK
jgi:hypothetical protein